MFFSVVVPVYNVEKYLRQCLDSLVNQTCADRELIIIDDGSTDSSAAICDLYAHQPNTIVLHQPHQGLAAARNAGLQLSTGDWLLFVDSDDWVELNMFEQLQAYILATNADSYRFNSITTDEDGSILHEEHFVSEDTLFSLPDEQTLFNYLAKYIVYIGCVWRRVYRASIIHEHQLHFIDEKEVYAEDRLFNFHYLLHVHSTLLIAFAPYHYRLRPDSLARSTPSKDKLIRAFNLIEYAYKAVVQCELTYFQNNFFDLYFSTINLFINNRVADLSPEELRPIIQQACRNKFHQQNFKAICKQRQRYEKKTRGRLWFDKQFGKRRSTLQWKLFLICQSAKYKRKHQTLEPLNYDRDQENRVAYLINSKAACSTIRVSMIRKDNVPDDYSVFAMKKVLSLQKPLQDEGWFTFSFVRNPFARLVSCYESKYHEDRTRNSRALQRGFLDLSLYLDGYMSQDKGFEHFIRQVLSIPHRLANRHFRSQYRLLVGKDGKPVVDFIGKVEHLAKDYEPIRERYGFGQLKHYNKANYGDWRDYYTAALARRVYRKYKKDVQYFGYEQTYRDLLAYCAHKEGAPRMSRLYWALWIMKENIKYALKGELLVGLNYYRDEQQRVAYMVVPKAACSSIRVSMLRRDDIPDDQSVHLIKNNLRQQQPFRDEGWFTFSFVRNPFERLVSCYEGKYHDTFERNARARQQGFFDFDKYLNGYMQEDKGFEHFVRQVVSLPFRLANPHFRSQYQLLIGKDGKPLVDYIGKVENIENDYEAIRVRYGFAPLKHYNKFNYGDWRDYYTTALARRVYRKYKKDVEYFGYEQEYSALLAYCKERGR